MLYLLVVIKYIKTTATFISLRYFMCVLEEHFAIGKYVSTYGNHEYNSCEAVLYDKIIAPSCEKRVV